jgi:molybdenum cofactor cytidylyltransferase
MHKLPITAIVLAAGASTRLDQPKQLLAYRGRSLLRYVAETAQASAAEEICVVLGFEAERMMRDLRGLDIRSVVNTRWEEGIGSSIRAGIASLSASTEAALLLLCDQPMVTTELLDTLIGVHKATGKPIVACEYGGSIGIPVLFGRRFFPDLLRLPEDRGAKELIRRHSSEAATVPFPGGTVDIDTAADYESLLSSGA